jgi:4-amino-4-deoxy-L-arabinose transferase-like glycosyltransferase
MRPDIWSIYLLTWILSPLIFFSVSKSKLPGYILPSILPFALLTAISLAKALCEPKVSRPSGYAVLALTPVVLVAALGGTIYLEAKRFLPNHFAMVLAIIALVTGTACLVLARSGRKVLLLATGVIGLVLCVEATDIWALPGVDKLVSSRRVAQIVRQHPQSTGAIVTLRLNRGWQYGLNFYLHREIAEWSGNTIEPAILIVSPDGTRELRRKHVEYSVIDDGSFEALVVQIGKPAAEHPNQISGRASP